MTQVKIILESDQGTESLWATQADDGFVIDSYPFFLKGVNFGDLVEATPIVSGMYKYVRTITKSPHSLYRVLFEDAHAARAEELLGNLDSLGCSHETGEVHSEVLIAVHIPGPVDANAAWSILETGLKEGTWQVQEGEDRHPCAGGDEH